MTVEQQSATTNREAGTELKHHEQYSGFWLRIFSTWIDCLIVYFLLTVCFYFVLFAIPSLYFPFNFTFFIVGTVYSVAMLAIGGQTVGKKIIGIKVTRTDKSKISIFQAVVRETILKSISAVFLFFGFLWIGFSKKKIAWHDYLSQTRVIQTNNSKGFKIWRSLALLSLLFVALNYCWNFISLIVDARRIKLNASSLVLPFMHRDPKVVLDVSKVKDTLSYVAWLNSNSQSPEEYALKIASAHQITLFGEQHENGTNLKFFNSLIAPLYYKAGVRVIAMEVIPTSMNSKVETLVNANTFDSTLFLEIARSQSWKMWGFKEYWDVLYNVWKLNSSLPNGYERLRLIGIDDDLNMVNVSLLGLSKDDDKGKPPLWERFRFFSAIKDFPNLVYRDNLMARNVEREIINKNKKAVILIGFNHTMISYTNTISSGNKRVAVNPRFGVLLSQKYPDKFFQIELYLKLDLDENGEHYSNTLDDFFDSVFSKRANKPIGFTIAGSPFEKLRDSCCYYWKKVPSARYGDVAEGLIFLRPLYLNNKCTWVPNYISDEMFLRYKPMYQLLARNRFQLKNAKQVNKLFAEN